MSRPLVALLVCASLLLVAGCDGSGSDSDDGAAQDAAAADTGPDSAVGTVRRLWRQVGGGSPAMVLEYHPRIRRVLGSSGILTVFNPPPAQFSGRPRIVAVESTPLGTQVTVRSRPQGSKTTYTVLYLLAKRGKRWTVRFDSSLNSAVSSYVTRRAQNRLNPNARRTSPSAEAAGDAAARELRALFTPGPRNGRLVPR